MKNWLKKVLPPSPNAADYRKRGNALLDLGKLDEAEQCYRQAIASDPQDATHHINLGYALKEQGRREEAKLCLQQAAALGNEIHDGMADTYYLLGILAQEEGSLEQATGFFHKALKARPDFAEAHRCLGDVLQLQGKLEDAIASYRTALSCQPADAQAYGNLGAALFALNKPDEAMDSLHQALAIDSSSANAYSNLGIVLHACSKLEAAVESFHHAILRKPDFAEAYSNLGVALNDQGKPEEALESFRKALQLKPDYPEARSNLLFVSNYSSSQYLEEAKQYGELVGKFAKPYAAWKKSSNTAPTTAPTTLSVGLLRVGLVSGDLRAHPVGYFLENVLAHIDPSKIVLTAYPTQRYEDEVTARIRSCCTAWTPIAGMSDGAAAQRIHGDDIDILIDLAGHTTYNRLPVFAWKPAPVQVSWLGYFASTGVKEIDYLLADPISVPASEQERFTETIWYLPDTRLCFTPPANAESKDYTVTPLPAVQNGYITFGCFQNLAKINDGVLAAWSKIMQALPQAKLRLQMKQLDSLVVRMDLQKRLDKAGISPDRVILKDPQTRAEYLAAHSEVDMLLDTFPYPGGTTTCEALWMGVPTLTCSGKSMLGRQGESFLSCVGLQDWIARDEREYVEKAIQHAQDVEGLARLRPVLRRQALASPLFDAPRFARQLETALHDMWRRKML